MGYFNTVNSEYVAAKVTNYGRKKISEGDFNISFFQIGDSEIDYNYISTTQKTLLPFDKDSFLKHPYRFSVSGTTYGVPSRQSEVYTIKNFIGSGSCAQEPEETWSICIVEGDSLLASSKLFFGYTSSDGQIDNETTTYYNGSEFLTLLPEDQTKIAVLFYNPPSGSTTEVKYKYDDYIYHDSTYFKITINGTGSVFRMDSRELFIDSTSADSKHNRFKYRYLLDGNNYKVGKIFVNQRIIIFDNLSTITDQFGSLTVNTITDFDGTIDLVRASDIYVMRYLIQLPTGQFEETQNPTYISGEKKITEVALLDENKEIVVIGKLVKPITRTGTQVISVKIDF